MNFSMTPGVYSRIWPVVVNVSFSFIIIYVTSFCISAETERKQRHKIYILPLYKKTSPGLT